MQSQFGAKIRALREKQNLFLRQVASLLEMDTAQLSKIEKGSRQLKREQIPSKNVVYVGDETRDVLAMKKAGIPVIAVSWGLTKKSTLLNLKPNDVADNPLDIPILSLNILK